jgi:hypothetical protein
LNKTTYYFIIEFIIYNQISIKHIFNDDANNKKYFSIILFSIIFN